MSAYVLPLSAVRQDDVATVGGKAAVLGTLIEAGFPVPAGLCITTAAFQLAFQPYRDRLDAIVRDYDLSHPAHAVVAANAMAELLADLTTPDEVVAALQAALPEIANSDTLVSVRSSATAEDRADVSFAGQYETVLGVRGEAAIRGAIITCWRSFFSANALVSRAATATLVSDESMAVLIQRMVDAECAGVCFSVDPVQRRRDLIVIDAAWGLGVGAVDGSVHADTTWVNRSTFAVDRSRIVEKPEQIALAPDGGVTRASVPDERRRAACLPETWSKRVAQFGLATELLLGRPQDIEWAIADGRVWILQSRPITTLPPELARMPHFPAESVGDDRHRFRELDGVSRERIVLPLEDEVYNTFHRAIEEAGYLGGGSPWGGTRVARWQSINGRRYSHQVSLDLGEGDCRIRRTAGQDLSARLRDQGVTRWEYVAPEVIGATDRLATFDHAVADGLKLAEHLEDAFGAFLRHWIVHWSPGGWDVFFGPYQAAFAAVAGLSGRDAEAEATKILGGEENFLTRLVDELVALAETARATPAVAALVAAHSPDALDRLSALPEAKSFLAQLEHFLAVFGERTGVGFGSGNSITTPTWREDGALILGLIAPYLDLNIEPPAAARARARQERDARVEALCAACADSAAVAELRRWLPYVRRAFTDLENHNHYIDSLSYGQLRRAILAAAGWLVACGALAQVDDVFWLHRGEIVAALRAETLDSLAPLVAERQAQHAEWAKLEPPAILGTPDASIDPRPPFKDDVTAERPEEASRLVGQAASAGRRRGRARVVTTGTLLPDVAPGDVLVAENAGPMWTPIFPILSGLVLDQGVLFQHAATTAREYGIPAVINTGTATRRIPDGAWVTVDGTAGTVELDQPDNASVAGALPSA